MSAKRTQPLPNPKHERFAQELARGKSQIEAYQAAGYKPHKSAASRLAEDVNVCERLAQLTGRAAERAVVTAVSLIAEAEEARQLAMSIDQPSAAVAAIQAKGKLAGVWVEKRENLNKNADRLTDNELAEYLTANGSAVDPEAKADQNKLN